MRYFIAIFAAALIAAPALGEPPRGEVTTLPIPRYVSIKTDEANARRGPSRNQRIDWVFTRPHMPVQIIAEYGHWRRVRDIEGAGGWVHYALLSGTRYVMVTSEATPLRRKPEMDARLVARAEKGVIARLGNCKPDWCKVSAEGLSGWVAKADIWGVDPGEIRD